MYEKWMWINVRGKNHADESVGIFSCVWESVYVVVVVFGSVLTGSFISLFKNLSYIVLRWMPTCSIRKGYKNTNSYLHFIRVKNIVTSCHSMIHYYFGSATNQHNYLHIISYRIWSFIRQKSIRQIESALIIYICCDGIKAKSSDGCVFHFTKCGFDSIVRQCAWWCGDGGSYVFKYG